jgi:hypothetical protein
MGKMVTAMNIACGPILNFVLGYACVHAAPYYAHVFNSPCILRGERTGKGGKSGLSLARAFWRHTLLSSFKQAIQAIDSRFDFMIQLLSDNKMA